MYVQLIYRAYAHGGSHNLPRLNCLTQQLYDRVRQFTFGPMRRLVLQLVADKVAPASLAEAEAAIANLTKKPKNVPDPLRQNIEEMPDEPLRALLLRLLDADANKLRNRVIHKDAHRPTREEATHAYDEAREILFGLTARLRLGHAAYWYISGAGR